MLALRFGFVVPLLFAAAYWYLSEQIPVLAFGDPLGPLAFPRVIMGLFCLAALVWGAEAVAGRSLETVPAPMAEPPDEEPASPWVAPAVLGWFVLYVVAVPLLGFLVATALFLGGLLLAFNRERWLANLIVAIAFPLGTHLVFVRILSIPLPRGSIIPI